jgi:hypothetical protein
MDQAYQKAVIRKKELEDELAEIELFLMLYERFSNGTEPEPDDARSESDRVEPTRGEPADFPRPRGNPDIIASMAEAVLKDVGRPMTRGELAREIEKRGTKLPAGDKAKYVGTILWRKNDRFANVGHGYWLKGLKVPKNEAEQRELRLIDKPI